MNKDDWGTIIRSLNVLTMAVRDLQNRMEAVEKSCTVLDYRTMDLSVAKYKNSQMTNCDTPTTNPDSPSHT